MGEAGKRAATYGAGTIFKRGRIWYVSYYVDGQQFIRSTRLAEGRAEATCNRELSILRIACVA